MLTLNTFIPKFNQIKPLNNNQNTPSINKYPNLAPLQYDTVSFGQTDKEKGDPRYGINLATAKKINAEAAESAKYLKYQLNQILGDLIKPEGGKVSFSRPIDSIAVRVKTPKSIKEKSATRKLQNEKEVKSKMTDIVGGRIVLGKTDNASVDKVLQRLTEAEASNKLRIIEIENYRPEPEIDANGNVVRRYDYGSANALRKLKSECDKKETSISKKDEDLPTGYMAIHLLTQLPNGFVGEIQIIGEGVLKLKRIEDMCYKVKSGKSLDKKYAPVVKLLKPLENKDDILLRKEFNKYTRDSYIYQRDKHLGIIPISENEFLPIPDYLPKELDFNNLAAKKMECDLKDN